MRWLGTVYESVRRTIVELVGGADATAFPVPACPGWSVHDVVSHLVGNCTDILTGNLDGAGTDGWTARQVQERRSRPTADVLAEWDESGSRIADLVDDFPGRLGRQVVADVTVHEHDLRGALERPGGRGSEGVAIGLDFLVAGTFGPSVAALGLGPLEVEADGRTWRAGTGEQPEADAASVVKAALWEGVDPSPSDRPAVGTLRADGFELFRALSGRRSALQIRDLDWSVDPEPYLRAIDLVYFAVRSTDLDE
jgi:uncharacterized protein (TIGR03083 family)